MHKLEYYTKLLSKLKSFRGVYSITVNVKTMGEAIDELHQYIKKKKIKLLCYGSIDYRYVVVGFKKYNKRSIWLDCFVEEIKDTDNKILKMSGHIL